MRKIITKEQELEICNFYLSSPMTLKSLADEFDLCKPTISKILNKNNIPIYKKAQIYNPLYIENYFENIDNQNKAYFIGLIISDGNIFKYKDNSGRQSSISITLQDNDKYMLEIFKNEVHSSTKVMSDGRGAYTIAIRSDKMASDLNRLHISETKSFNTKFPFNIDKSMYHHVIRGILDGDGSVQAKQTNIRNRYKHSIGFCGTKTLMEDIRFVLTSVLNVTNVSVYSYKQRSLSMVTWASVNDIEKIYHYLYDGAILYLTRKKDKCEDILRHYNL